MWLDMGSVAAPPAIRKPGAERDSFAFTQDQLGSINGFGVDQLMAIVFRCFDSVCTHICMCTTVVQCRCLNPCPGLWHLLQNCLVIS